MHLCSKHTVTKNQDCFTSTAAEGLSLPGETEQVSCGSEHAGWPGVITTHQKEKKKTFN